MKKNYCVWILFVFFAGLFSSRALELDIKSQNALLYNLDENKVLYAKNAEEMTPIASITKIMTAIVAYENTNSLETKITITKEDLKGLKEANASVAGFYVGQQVTIEDLLYGLLLPSGADAALTLTHNITENRDAFNEKKKQKAHELGMEHTQFQNETGLDESGHYSTLEDVAIMFRYALENPKLKQILESSSYVTSDKKLRVTSTITRFKNRNNLTMDYLLGGKTGTTENAGLCLASIASQNNSNYMLITTKAPQNGSTPNHLLDAKTIYEYFINHYETKNVLEKEEQILSLPTKDSNQKEIKFYANEEVNKYLPKEFQKDMLEYHYDGKQEITPDMQAGTKLGTVTIDFQREHLANIEIILNESIPFDLITYFQNRPYIIGLILLIIILGIIMMIRIVRKKKIMLKK